jgi:hypothetical protein
MAGQHRWARNDYFLIAEQLTSRLDYLMRARQFVINDVLPSATVGSARSSRSRSWKSLPSWTWWATGSRAMAARP